MGLQNTCKVCYAGSVRKRVTGMSATSSSAPTSNIPSTRAAVPSAKASPSMSAPKRGRVRLVPQCGSREGTTRHLDTLTCPCGFEGHADLTASETFLRRHEADVPRPMARPVCLKWDGHRWSASPRSPRPNEEHTNPQVASVDSA